MTFIGGTDIGLMRKTNQDRFACATISGDLAFAVLCDGMGGHNGGNIASETATRFVVDMLTRDLKDGMTELTLRSVLSSAVAGANALVHDAAKHDPNLASMGTTLVAAVLAGQELHITYVGDSRLYVVTEEKETQLTKDHTVVQMLVDIGEISKEDAQSHPKRHYITRAIGVASTVEADYLVHTLAEEELVLLCSDGLYNYLEPGMLYPLLRDCVKAGNVQALIDLAREKGGSDNITAIAGAYQQPLGGYNLNG